MAGLGKGLLADGMCIAARREKGMKNPCFVDGRDCPRRQAGCARTCPDWAAYCVERDKIWKRRYEENEAKSVIIEGSIRAKVKHMMRRRGK